MLSFLILFVVFVLMALLCEGLFELLHRFINWFRQHILQEQQVRCYVETGNPVERDDEEEEEGDNHQPPHVQETQPPAENNREHQRNPINVLAMIDHVLAFQQRLERQRLEEDIQKREENRLRREAEDLEWRRNMIEERERLQRETLEEDFQKREENRLRREADDLHERERLQRETLEEDFQKREENRLRREADDLHERERLQRETLEENFQKREENRLRREAEYLELKHELKHALSAQLVMPIETGRDASKLNEARQTEKKDQVPLDHELNQDGCTKEEDINEDLVLMNQGQQQNTTRSAGEKDTDINVPVHEDRIYEERFHEEAPD